MYADTVAITERRIRTGFVAELDVVRVHTELTSIESDALLLERRRGEFEHALAVLIGEVASTFELEQQEWAVVVPGHFLPLGLIARACR